MRNFFNPENWLWRGFGLLADYFLLSACWFLCSIPVVTVGSASIALYDAVAHCVKGGEEHMIRRFFRTFKNELLRGCLLTLLFAGLALLLNGGYQVMTQLGSSETMKTLSMVYFCLLLLPLGWACWCLALESRFVYPLGQLLKNALAFTFGHLPQTLAIALVFVVGYNVLLNFPFAVMVVPAPMAHLQSLFIEKVFVKYMPPKEEESIEETPEA